MLIRRMTFEDVPFGLRLCRDAGWNQVPADWARFLHLQPDGCFVAERDGIPCGTVTTCRFGAVAWIGMMLVEKQHRRKGIGRALMTHALDHLDSQGVRTVRLDATAMGEPLYRSMGFVEQFRLGRFAGEPSPDVEGTVEGRPEWWDDACRLDREATGTDRRRLLLALFHERSGNVRIVQRQGKVSGFLTSRRGMRSAQIGPCIADAESGPLLLGDALSRFARRPVYIDIPLDHRASIDLVESRGLSVLRTLLRMCRGEPVVEHIDLMWAGSGPEKG